MQELFLHIGHSKCASSTIQAYLSRNSLATPTRNLVYHCVIGPGRVLRGEEISARVANDPTGYLSSDIDFENPMAFLETLAQIKDEGRPECVVLSSEGLANPWLRDEYVAALDALDVPIHILLMTRPPADWLNASWWQWGCWLDLSVDQWIQRMGHTINFASRLQPWRALRNLETVHVADISQDPIQQLREFLGLSPALDYEQPPLNTATSADLLRFLINKKDILNRTIHDPRIEFELSNVIEPSGGYAPFVLDKEMVRESIFRSRDDHETLLEQMRWNDDARIEETVSRYLDPETYDNVCEEFDFATFLKQAPSPAFLAQINDWLLERLRTSTSLGREFNAERYLEKNPDVAAAGVNPYEHFLIHGLRERREH